MKVAVFGRSEVLFGILENLVAEHHITAILSPPEAPQYTKSSAEFEEVARALGVSFSSRFEAESLPGFLSQGEPDIGVSVNFPAVLPSEVIDIFPHGVLNVHGGDLPRYRGNACQAWAILNGEDKVGLCVHKMDGGQLDSGDIIARDYLPLTPSTSITEVHGWMVARAPDLVTQALRFLDADASFVLERQSDSPNMPLRTFPRRPEDARIDWLRPAIDVVRLIKASSRPYRGAYCGIGDKELVIWDADLEPAGEEFLAVPGQVVSHSAEEFVVAAGSGAVRIKSWQLANQPDLNPPLRLSVRERLS